MKLQRKSQKEQNLDGELGLIIDEMGRAMWNSNKFYIAKGAEALPLTYNMKAALLKFVGFCRVHYGK